MPSHLRSFLTGAALTPAAVSAWWRWMWRGVPTQPGTPPRREHPMFEVRVSTSEQTLDLTGVAVQPEARVESGVSQPGHGGLTWPTEYAYVTLDLGTLGRDDNYGERGRITLRLSRSTLTRLGQACDIALSEHAHR